MTGLVKLPALAEEETFLSCSESLDSYYKFKEFNFSVEKYLKFIKKEEKNKQRSENLESDDEDDEDSVDDDVYAVIPDDYDFKCQVPYDKLDAKNWRKQDHYKVLGLDEFRWATRPEDLRRAYRSLILKYHPDKGKVKEVKGSDRGTVFACMTKAYEFLIQPKKRRSYDSFDPEFDDSLPSKKSLSSYDEFENRFKQYFDLNQRWSRHLIPEFGDENSTFEHVDKFYQAWFDFSSWREFTYEKLEELEFCEDGYERRWLATQMKKESDKKRKDEAKRIRQLVDSAYNLDPRIKKFRKQHLAEKEAEKAAKKAKREEERQALLKIEQAKKEAEEAKIRQAEEAEKKIRDEERKKKEAGKREIKKKRQLLRKTVVEKLGQSEALNLESEVNLICTQLDAVQLEEIAKNISELEKFFFHTVTDSKITYL